MKARSPMLWLFGVLAAVQLAVPALHIASFEKTLQTGALYRFRCEPVDPFDAFRGRFVRVAPRLGPVPWTGGALSFGERIYVVLREGEEGFAEPAGAARERPEQGDYIAARYQWRSTNEAILVTLPFDRYYMPENLAPLAERAYRESVRATNAWLAVRVRAGKAVIENLYIGDRPIAEVAREMIEER